MKTSPLFIIAIFSALLLNCKFHKTQHIVPEEYNVINAHFKRLHKDDKLFHKTLINMSSGDLLVDRISVGQLNFHRFKNGLPKQVDFDTIFNTKTIDYLKDQFSTLEIEQLDKALVQGINIVENDKNRLVLYTTKPVITKNGKYALFYTETKSSGNLWVYKKNDKGEWNIYSTSPFWIE